MSNWTATNELRWYVNTEREPYSDYILQQKWQSDEKRPFYDCFMTEWRDVPVVEEE